MSGKPEQKGTGPAKKPEDKPKPAAAAQKPAGEKKPEGAPAKPQTDKKPADRPATAAAATKDAPAAAKPAGETKPAAAGDKAADGRKTAEGKGPRQPREKKEGDEERKDRKKEGGERPPRRPKTEGNGDAPDGEKREKKKRAPRERNDDWKTTLVITIDTPIPPAPEKKLTKPDAEKLKKDLEDCDRKIKQIDADIEALKDKREKWRKDQRKKLDEARSQNDAAFKEKIEEFASNKAKFEEHNKLKEKLAPLKDRLKVLDDEIKVLAEKQHELEKQFLTKSAQSIEQVLEQIERIDYSLANDKLTGTEEKKLLAEKFALNKSIPVAKEYGVIAKQVKELREKRKPILDEMKPIKEIKKPLDEEVGLLLKQKKADAPKIKAEREQREKDKAERKLKAEKPEGDKDAEPEEKKEKRVPDDPFSPQIDEKYGHKKEQYQRKDRLRQNFQADWDKYLDQQDELYKIEFIKKRRDYLLTIHNAKQDRAKRERERLLERYINEHTPEESAEEHFSELTNACENLIPALAALLPQNRRLLQSISVDDTPQFSREEIEAKLKDDKKLAGLGLKLAVVKQSVEPPGKGKKDNKKKPETKAAPTTAAAPEAKEDFSDPDRKLILDLVVREYFDKLKLTPPVLVKDLEGAISAVEKKKSEISGLIASKADEIKKIHEEADKNVPSIDELIASYKDFKPPREDGKGDHGHKNQERKGARGGRRNDGGNTQWRGPGNAKHARREGDVEREDLAEEKPAREPERPVERQRPQKPLVAEDFPSI